MVVFFSQDSSSHGMSDGSQAVACLPPEDDHLLVQLRVFRLHPNPMLQMLQLKIAETAIAQTGWITHHPCF
jgi:hypothetical protein